METPGAEVPGKELVVLGSPSSSTSGRLDYRREPAQLALRKGKCWMRWMVGRDKEAVTPGWGSGCPPGSRRPLPLTLITAVATSPAGCPHHWGLREPEASTPSVLPCVPAWPDKGLPSVRDLATSPLWQRVREGGGIISSKRRKW